jgi:hypothetical protein
MCAIQRPQARTGPILPCCLASKMPNSYTGVVYRMPYHTLAITARCLIAPPDCLGAPRPSQLAAQALLPREMYGMHQCCDTTSRIRFLIPHKMTQTYPELCAQSPTPSKPLQLCSGYRPAANRYQKDGGQCWPQQGVPWHSAPAQCHPEQQQRPVLLPCCTCGSGRRQSPMLFHGADIATSQARRW